MPTNPRPKPLVYVEIEVNYRWRNHRLDCAFVTLIEQRGELHRRVVDTRHLADSPERLVDQVNALVREWTHEYILTSAEPF